MKQIQIAKKNKTICVTNFLGCKNDGKKTVRNYYLFQMLFGFCFFWCRMKFLSFNWRGKKKNKNIKRNWRNKNRLCSLLLWLLFRLIFILMFFRLNTYIHLGACVCLFICLFGHLFHSTFSSFFLFIWGSNYEPMCGAHSVSIIYR